VPEFVRECLFLRVRVCVCVCTYTNAHTYTYDVSSKYTTPPVKMID